MNKLKAIAALLISSLFVVGVIGVSAPANAANLAATKSLTEGPYYLDGDFVRAEITEGQTGLAQNLTFTVVDTKGKVHKNYSPDKTKGLHNTSNAQDQIVSSLGTAGLKANTLKNAIAAKKVTSTAKIVLQ